MIGSLPLPLDDRRPFAVEFFASGQPATKGSARAFVVNPKGGGRPRAVITNDAGHGAKVWASVVRDAAREAMADARPVLGGWPMRVAIVFLLPRPQSHRRANGQLKPTAPRYVATRPDIDKTARCAIDSLIGVVFTDDSQIAVLAVEKQYADDGRIGARFQVEAIPAHER